MNFPGKILLFFLVCQSCLIGQVVVPTTQPLNLDLILEWQSPSITKIETIENLLAPLEKFSEVTTLPDQSGNPVEYRTWKVINAEDHFVTVFKGLFRVHHISLMIVQGMIRQCSFMIDRSTAPGESDEALKDYIAQLLQTKPTLTTQKSSDGMEISQASWTVGGRTVTIRSREGGFILLSITDPLRPISPTNPSDSASPPVVKVDLDPLMDLSQLWTWTPQMLEEKFIVKVEENQEKIPEFQWLNSTKERARFSRKAFSDVDTRLMMFGKSVRVEEVVVEFVNGKAARVTVSFYNRGDSGDILMADFMGRFKKVGQILGQVLKVAPSNQSAVASTAIKTVSWQWKSPAGIALLEHNDYTAGGSMGKPEFLRMKLASPDQADWSMGKLAVGVQRMALLKNIVKTADGDTYIAGVPMVDQGAKGYCVAASCQRLLEYMQIPCDQHEIAQLVKADAQAGASIFVMQKSLSKIDGQFKVAFKPHINPELYYSSGRKRRISQRQFSIIVKEHVDKGVPLLWALELGHYPETPPLPNEGQVSGGHMRMVIGYNTAKNEILFTDSWGAGHELKRMSEGGAYEVTMGLYSMSPRGL